MGYQSVKPLGITGATLGIIQAIVWLLASLAGILVYLDVFESPLTNNEQTHTGRLGYWLHRMFVDQSWESPVGPVVTSAVFYAFLWVYFGLSIIWLGISSAVLWSCIHEKIKPMKISFFSWAILVITISLVDLALTILLGIDYDYWTKLESVSTNPDVNTYTYPLLCTAIVMCLAARGFVLWVINIIFAFIFAKNIKLLTKNSYASTQNQFLSAYTPSASPWTIQDPFTKQSKGFENPSYDFDSDFYNTPVNQSSIFGEDTGRKNSVSSSPIYQNRTATIGRSKGKTLIPAASPKIPRPTNQEPPVFIPPPDYSPVSSKKLKSVLKAKSQFDDETF